jgi:hypothetical protein
VKTVREGGNSSFKPVQDCGDFDPSLCGGTRFKAQAPAIDGRVGMKSAAASETIFTDGSSQRKLGFV